jgi:hypothetical protein
MATDEEVEEQRNVVEELRARVEAAKTDGATAQRELDNEIHLTKLQGEEASLRAQLAEIEAQNDPDRMARAATPLATAKEQMVAAVEAQKAATQAIADQDSAAARAAAPPAPATVKAIETTTEKKD